MSFADYLRLRNYLDRPGETVVPPYPDEFVTIVVSPDPLATGGEPDQSVCVRRDMLVQLRKICTHTFNDDEDRDSLSMLAEAAAKLMALDSRNAPAIDRLAMKDLTVTMFVDHSLESSRPVGPGFEPSLSLSLAEPAVSVTLPRWKCKRCRGSGESKLFGPSDRKLRPPIQCFDCNGHGDWVKHTWLRPTRLVPQIVCPGCRGECEVFYADGDGGEFPCDDCDCTGKIDEPGPGPWGLTDSPSCRDLPMGVVPSGNLAWHRLCNLEFRRIYARDFPGLRGGQELASFALSVMTSAKFRVMLARQAVEAAEAVG